MTTQSPTPSDPLLAQESPSKRYTPSTFGSPSAVGSPSTDPHLFAVPRPPPNDPLSMENKDMAVVITLPKETADGLRHEDLEKGSQILTQLQESDTKDTKGRVSDFITFSGLDGLSPSARVTVMWNQGESNPVDSKWKLPFSGPGKNRKTDEASAPGTRWAQDIPTLILECIKGEDRKDENRKDGERTVLVHHSEPKSSAYTPSQVVIAGKYLLPGPEGGARGRVSQSHNKYHRKRYYRSRNDALTLGWPTEFAARHAARSKSLKQNEKAQELPLVSDATAELTSVLVKQAHETVGILQDPFFRSLARNLPSLAGEVSEELSKTDPDLYLEGWMRNANMVPRCRSGDQRLFQPVSPNMSDTSSEVARSGPEKPYGHIISGERNEPSPTPELTLHETCREPGLNQVHSAHSNSMQPRKDKVYPLFLTISPPEPQKEVSSSNPWQLLVIRREEDEKEFSEERCMQMAADHFQWCMPSVDQTKQHRLQYFSHSGLQSKNKKHRVSGSPSVLHFLYEGGKCNSGCKRDGCPGCAGASSALHTANASGTKAASASRAKLIRKRQNTVDLLYQDDSKWEPPTIAKRTPKEPKIHTQTIRYSDLKIIPSVEGCPSFEKTKCRQKRKRYFYSSSENPLNRGWSTPDDAEYAADTRKQSAKSHLDILLRKDLLSTFLEDLQHGEERHKIHSREDSDRMMARWKTSLSAKIASALPGFDADIIPHVKDLVNQRPEQEIMPRPISLKTESHSNVGEGGSSDYSPTLVCSPRTPGGFMNSPDFGSQHSSQTTLGPGPQEPYEWALTQFSVPDHIPGSQQKSVQRSHPGVIGPDSPLPFSEGPFVSEGGVPCGWPAENRLGDGEGATSVYPRRSQLSNSRQTGNTGKTDTRKTVKHVRFVDLPSEDTHAHTSLLRATQKSETALSRLTHAGARQSTLDLQALGSRDSL